MSAIPDWVSVCRPAEIPHGEYYGLNRSELAQKGLAVWTEVCGQTLVAFAPTCHSLNGFRIRRGQRPPPRRTAYLGSGHYHSDIPTSTPDVLAPIAQTQPADPDDD